MKLRNAFKFLRIAPKTVPEYKILSPTVLTNIRLMVQERATMLKRIVFIDHAIAQPIYESDPNRQQQQELVANLTEERYILYADSIVLNGLIERYTYEQAHIALQQYDLLTQRGNPAIVEDFQSPAFEKHEPVMPEASPDESVRNTVKQTKPNKYSERFK